MSIEQLQQYGLTCPFELADKSLIIIHKIQIQPPSIRRLPVSINPRHFLLTKV